MSAPQARTGSAVDNGSRRSRCLRGASEFYDRQVLAAAMTADFQDDISARLAAHKRPGPRARRPARPGGAWLVPRTSVCRKLAMVGFVRRSAAQGSVWPMAILPFNNRINFLSEQVAPVRHEKQSGQNRLERKNEAFGHPFVPISNWAWL